ncbi:uncharacterized protein LOC122401677 [Colletes gigas]|uniref:uncharacterized protein LOC122401677 n=1 Tax=Colletes gigas TaxID=935657 RepID=UPI001C9B4520|nr:uncharacterized protein LOC122401677 [Colletes gigas]
MIKKLEKIESFNGRKTWKLFHATDFDSLMYPNFCISLALGLFPYKWESTRYVLSRKRFVCSVATIPILVGLMLFLLYEMNFGNLSYSALTSKIDTNFVLIFYVMATVVMQCCSLSRLHVIKNLLEASQILSPKDFNDLAKLFHTKDILGFLFLAIHLPNCFKGNAYVTARHLTFLYLMIVNFLLDMSYMNCVCVLKACFKKVNECLEQLNKSSTNDVSVSEIPWVEKAPGNKHRNTLLLTKLKSLLEKHLQISDVVQLLNNTFLVKIVTLVITTFIIVTFNSYFVILRMYRSFGQHLQPQFWYIQFLSSILYEMSKFMMLIWACETAKNEALKIGTTVHDARSNTTDTLMKHELELFPLQVLQRDNTFSARAVTMNAALLTQIAGDITIINKQ